MILLIAFAFLAGIVTILSPCILPILPVVLSSSIDTTGIRRPIGIVMGFILSFTFFTLFLSTIVKISGIPADILRLFSVIVIASFGLSLLTPQFQILTERLFSKLSALVPNGQKKTGFHGGLLIGLSLGLLWTPCVGPILASVISLAITGEVTFNAVLITLAFSLGTAIPMFLIMVGGQSALKKVPWLVSNTIKIQKAFGVIMIITAIAILFNFDRKFQSLVLEKFPNYGVGLTKLEDNEAVREQLKKINSTEVKKEDMGKPMSDFVQKGPPAPEIIEGGKWFNSKSLTLAELRGKVVLIDFWTYSCINCQRTLPYLRQWYEKYNDKGLVIIGVHSPEFEFEKSEKNVAQAIADFKLKYPIVQDNNFATWRAYSNQYWPAKYFIDKDGFIRYVHFGEGAYNESEKAIQDLLKESGIKNISSLQENEEYQLYSKTPETYLGYGRISNLASNEQIEQDGLSKYSAPRNLPDNSVAYKGEWIVTSEYANPQNGATLFLNFEAKEVYLVIRPKTDKASVEVYLDDKLQNLITIDTDKLYRIINLETPGRHNLRLEFLDKNAEVYAFTFG
ncbi:MAG: hypothetical protein A2798_01495 [Candidatus Levybacteria bacterium RIFCSPHIGHO2_01_FULL_37_17]|nr:MAG: hypothetical protein A2798_01495 [Candidatus Levybacteria bacterium RIFCSPHIGHO2_01_FULL_37_17]OGH37123.1 MAG: hypothetical protein A2959_02355 [Candidatus Levybacteria bacterium RIFCSPLOWO2_01_FULL_38_23]